MERSAREFALRRAGDACEYCRMPQATTPLVPFHVEHIIAKQHGGTDDLDGLAIACDRCNAFKGTNLTSIDPESGNIVLLFNPRSDVWEEHFAFEGAVIVALTPSGRATLRLLQMNAVRRVQLREEWLAEHGWI